MESWEQDNIYLVLFTILVGMLCAVLIIVFAMYIFHMKTLTSISRIKGVKDDSKVDQDTIQNISSKPAFEKPYVLNSDHMDIRSQSFSFSPGRKVHSYPKRLGLGN